MVQAPDAFLARPCGLLQNQSRQQKHTWTAFWMKWLAPRGRLCRDAEKSCWILFAEADSKKTGSPQRHLSLSGCCVFFISATTGSLSFKTAQGGQGYENWLHFVVVVNTCLPILKWVRTENVRMFCIVSSYQSAEYPGCVNTKLVHAIPNLRQYPIRVNTQFASIPGSRQYPVHDCTHLTSIPSWFTSISSSRLNPVSSRQYPVRVNTQITSIPS